MQKKRVDYIILGAGCAGLSMAVELLRAEANAAIVLIDTRVDYTRDHTWCFWQMDPQAWYTPAIGYHWHTWSLMHADKQHNSHSAKYPYVHINALDYYALAQKILACGNVQWLLGTRVTDITCDDAAMVVTTATNCFQAKYLFDSRPPKFNLSQEKNFLLQCFRGWHIKTAQECFNPGAVTLMDFRLPQYEQIHFMYILPFSTTEALVEPTFFLNRAEDFPELIYLQTLKDYLAQHYGLTEYIILHKESGCLPMISTVFNRQPHARWYTIGAAAGLLRPSTGYGFCGIQRYSQKLVQNLQQKSSATPPLPYSASSQWMDQLLLQVLYAAPERGAQLLMQIFTRTPSETNIRFLSDAATYSDIWRMLNAVPRYDFLRQQLKSLRLFPREQRES